MLFRSHPDETHDGRAGSSDGFGYRIVYVAPARIHDAARAIRGRPCALPFVREPVTALEITDYCSRQIGPFKVPRIIEFRDSLPRNAMGKLQREKL